jgi:hypothetical protein
MSLSTGKPCEYCGGRNYDGRRRCACCGADGVISREPVFSGGDKHGIHVHARTNDSKGLTNEEATEKKEC